MNKKLLYLATIILTLAGCSSEEYIGDPSLHEANDTPPIQFDGGTEVITRATSNTGTAPHKLDYQFKLYGVKSGATAGQNMQKVFVNYKVWHVDNSANTTTSNSSNWEYVGDIGTHGTVTLESDQTIKFWDYSAADYRFVAGSPVSAFTFTNTSDTDPTIATATVTGLAGHITANTTGPAMTANPVYVAKPKKISKTQYRQPVIFEFVRQQAQVRVGIYETIPGYIISDIHFYEQKTTSGTSDWKDSHESGNNVILTSMTSDYFVGGLSAGGTITYKWTASPPSYTFSYGTSETMTKAQNWYGGAFSGSGSTPAVKATTSADAAADLFGADGDMAANGFFTVLPTPIEIDAAPILIKCDYILKSIDENSNETIEVKGATAAIPAAFCKWEPNTMYTYLFKISDNTNGSTGQDIQGLFPITFDAETTAGGSVGITTTITMPSITTYQEGSVVDRDAVGETPAYHGIKYEKDKLIYTTVQSGVGELLSLNTTDNSVGCVKVYYLGTTAKTEAELQVTSPQSPEATLLDEDNMKVGSSDASLENGTITLAGSKYLTFTPADDGYYAIQYVVSVSPIVYAYKVVYVGDVTVTPTPEP